MHDRTPSLSPKALSMRRVKTCCACKNMNFKICAEIPQVLRTAWSQWFLLPLMLHISHHIGFCGEQCEWIFEATPHIHFSPVHTQWIWSQLTELKLTELNELVLTFHLLSKTIRLVPEDPHNVFHVKIYQLIGLSSNAPCIFAENECEVFFPLHISMQCHPQSETN